MWQRSLEKRWNSAIVKLICSMYFLRGSQFIEATHGGRLMEVEVEEERGRGGERYRPLSTAVAHSLHG